MLFIGNADGANTVTPIGSKLNFGTLTANAVMVTNSTSGIDKIIVANLQPIGLYANGSLGSSGDLLFSNGTAVYWAPSSGASVNVNATYSWTNTHTFTIDSIYFNANIVQNPRDIVDYARERKKDVVKAPARAIHYGFKLDDIWDLGPRPMSYRL